ncbi:MAG: hypothetical protein AMJ81_13660, partial [Phycisphaerae bacterium SM23_33]
MFQPVVDDRGKPGLRCTRTDLLLSAQLLLAACAAGVMLVRPVAGLAEATKVPLTLAGPAGIRRVREPVTTGIPIPKGGLKSVKNVRLLRDGKEVPAQFRAAGLWRPGGSIRWLLVDLQADVEAGGRQAYTLEYGRGVTAAAKPAAVVRIDENAHAYVVDTGATTFRVS